MSPLAWRVGVAALLAGGCGLSGYDPAAFDARAGGRSQDGGPGPQSPSDSGQSPPDMGDGGAIGTGGVIGTEPAVTADAQIAEGPHWTPAA